jgi:hypothetical protein
MRSSSTEGLSIYQKVWAIISSPSAAERFIKLHIGDQLKSLNR